MSGVQVKEEVEKELILLAEQQSPSEQLSAALNPLHPIGESS
jgi:hypothetical protein